eukprot:359258-Chlamydomonas_euryale.AAC.11
MTTGWVDALHTGMHLRASVPASACPTCQLLRPVKRHSEARTHAHLRVSWSRWRRRLMSPGCSCAQTLAMTLQRRSCRVSMLRRAAHRCASLRCIALRNADTEGGSRPADQAVHSSSNERWMRRSRRWISGSVRDLPASFAGFGCATSPHPGKSTTGARHAFCRV